MLSFKNLFYLTDLYQLTDINRIATQFIYPCFDQSYLQLWQSWFIKRHCLWLNRIWFRKKLLIDLFIGVLFYPSGIIACSYQLKKVSLKTGIIFVLNSQVPIFEDWVRVYLGTILVLSLIEIHYQQPVPNCHYQNKIYPIISPILFLVIDQGLK